MSGSLGVSDTGLAVSAVICGEDIFGQVLMKTWTTI